MSNFLHNLATITVGFLTSIGLLVAPVQTPIPVQTPTLGAAITQGGALYDGYLASGIGKSDTSMTLSSGAFKDGTSLSGWNCFTADINTPSVEYICGTASGTAVTALWRGLSLTNPNVTSSALAYTHNRFTSVQITDYPDLQILKRILNGTDVVPNALKYDPSVTSSSLAGNLQNLASVAYANGISTAGAPNGSITVKGLYQEATKAQTAAGNATGSTGADLVVPSAYFSTTSTATTTVPVTNGSGTLATGFIAQDASSSYSFLGGVAIASGTIGTSTYTGTQNFSAATLSGLPNYLAANFQVGVINPLVAGQAVFIGNGTTGYLDQSQTVTSTSVGNNYGSGCGNNPGACTVTVSQTFTASPSSTALRAVQAYLSTDSLTNIGRTVTASIYAVTNGAPTGGALGTSNSYSPAASIAATTTNLTFSPLVALTPGTRYAIRLDGVCSQGGNDCNGANISFFYKSGTQYQSEYWNTYNGSVWATSTANEGYFKTYTAQTSAGKVYPTDTTLVPFGTDANEALGFAGFALNNAATGTTASILIGGITNNLSGLTSASTYYLNGASGAVSSSAGSPSLKIGLAVSSTAILIKQDNP